MLFLLKKFRFAALLLSLMGVLAGTGWAQDPGAPALPPQAPAPSTPPVVDVVTLFGGSLPTAPLSGTFGTTPAPFTGTPITLLGYTGFSPLPPPGPVTVVSTTTTTTRGSFSIATGVWANYVTTTTTTTWSNGTVTVETTISSTNGTLWYSVVLTSPQGGPLSSTTVTAEGSANGTNPPQTTTPPYTIITVAPAPGYPAGYTEVTTTVWTPSPNGLSYTQTSQDEEVLDTQGNVIFPPQPTSIPMRTPPFLFGPTPMPTTPPPAVPPLGGPDEPLIPPPGSSSSPCPQ